MVALAQLGGPSYAVSILRSCVVAWYWRIGRRPLCSATAQVFTSQDTFWWKATIPLNVSTQTR